MVIELTLIALGLVVFEVISSIDNAVINANVLGTVSAKSRIWFLTWGLLISVVLVRGLLPLIVVWLASPSLGFAGAFTASFSSDPLVKETVESAKPALLGGGGLYLVLLAAHWLLGDNQHYAFGYERWLARLSPIWFYLIAVIIIASAILAAGNQATNVVIGMGVGAVAYFLTAGLKIAAEATEGSLGMGRDMLKLIYLELIDATFSIDGVLGAFAFTTAVPLILIGNGVGAVVVRQITIKGVSAVKRLPYLTNGAMYSVALLGLVMMFEALDHELPFYVTPMVALIVVGYFVWRSYGANQVSS